MVDIRTKEKRSRMMAAVHSKNTGSELCVRRFLWAKGIRYRLHDTKLPGTPDIVIPRCSLAIFVHGCFWHGHENCSLGHLPKSRIEYWTKKIERNKLRDHQVEEKLKEMGWHILIVWHCQLRTKKAASIALPDLLSQIKKNCVDSSE